MSANREAQQISLGDAMQGAANDWRRQYESSGPNAGLGGAHSRTTSEETILEAIELLTALHYELAAEGVRDSPEGFSARKVAALDAAGLLRREMTEEWADTLGNDGRYEYTTVGDCHGTWEKRLRRTPRRVIEATDWEEVPDGE